jgi:hypothetical protein
MIFSQPDDFFLTANATVIVSVATWTLANGDTIFDDPRKVSRRNT